MNQHEKTDRFIQLMLAGASADQLEVESKGLDLNEVGVHGFTPLSAAASEGLLTAVETLVRLGASVRARDSDNLWRSTALHEAAKDGRLDVAKYLLSHGAEIDAEATQGVTPLMCAAAFGEVEMVKLLLDNHADPAKKDDTGFTAADTAREKGQDAAADVIDAYLLQRGKSMGSV